MTHKHAADIAFNECAIDAAAILIGRLRRFANEIDPRGIVALAASQNPGVDLHEATKNLAEAAGALMREATERSMQVNAAIAQLRATVQPNIDRAVSVKHLMVQEREAVQALADNWHEAKRAKLERLEGILSVSELAAIAAEPAPDYAQRIAVLNDRIDQIDAYLKTSGTGKMPEFVKAELRFV